MGAPLDLELTIPADAQLAGIVRDVAAQAARHRGRADERASAFARGVEEAVREACSRGAIDKVVCLVRCAKEPLEVVISSAGASRTLTLD